MKKYFIITFIVFIILLFIIGLIFMQNNNKITIKKQSIKLGYCPTMSNIAKEIDVNNPHIQLIAYDSTAQAFQSLNNKEVNVVLVGRLAKENEITKKFERRLRGGVTLVGKEKKIISVNDLYKVKIHTYLSKEQTQEYITNTKNVIFHDSLKSTIENGINEILLIKWSDFTDELELIIPVDDKINKIEKFRIPVLYSTDYNLKEIKI